MGVYFLNLGEVKKGKARQDRVEWGVSRGAKAVFVHVSIYLSIYLSICVIDLVP